MFQLNDGNFNNDEESENLTKGFLYTLYGIAQGNFFTII